MDPDYLRRMFGPIDDYEDDEGNESIVILVVTDADNNLVEPFS